MPKVNIFISHSEADKEIVGKFVDLLVLAELGDSATIFCSSKQRFDIPNGLDPKQFIKEKLGATAVVVAILTPNYWESKFSLCELGAAWVKCRLFALTVPPDTYRDAKAILTGASIHQLSNAEKLSDVLDEIARMNDVADPTSINARGRSGRFSQLASEFADAVEQYVERQKKKTGAAKKQDSPETKSKLNAAISGNEGARFYGSAYSVPIDSIKFPPSVDPLLEIDNTVRKMTEEQRRRHGVIPFDFDAPKSTGNRGRRANKAPDPTPKTRGVDGGQERAFAGLVEKANNALNALSQAVQTALFRYTNEGSVSTQSLNPRQVQTAIDKGQFKGISDDGRIQINFQNKDIAAFHDQFYKLGDLLAAMNDDTKNEARKNHGGVELNPDTWDFWVNLLDYKD